MTCHACGAQLSANARFCHKCGAATQGAAASTTGLKAGLPWGLAGLAVGALVTILALRVNTGGGPTPPPPRPTVAPDISQMSPEERANRLFNRVMTWAQAGQNDSVQFFLPMAIGAFTQLPALDVDARYHIGLLQLAGGDAAAALAQADTIQRTVATHLFVHLLRAHAYQQQGNTQGEARAYADFLRHEAAERARNRPEYQDHQEALSAFGEKARARPART